VAHCKNPLDIHVYREIFDDENLYIEFNQHSSITKFKVPLGVALAISHRLMYTLEETQRCAAMTDEDITAECLTAVDERMSFHSSIRELVGALRFGSCDNPIEQQVRHGVENMKAGRENCRRILQMAEEVTRGVA
jgi:hypothetical protein